MYRQTMKPKENPVSADRRTSRAVSNRVAQKKSRTKEGYGLVDNRPNPVIQRMFGNLNLSSFYDEYSNQTPQSIVRDQLTKTVPKRYAKGTNLITNLGQEVQDPQNKIKLSAGPITNIQTYNPDKKEINKEIGFQTSFMNTPIKIFSYKKKLGKDPS